MKDDTPFWKTKALEDMNQAEWESLCDGCGLCCLNKIEFEDTGEVVFTSLGCKYLDLHACQCVDYANRKTNLPDCVELDAKAVHTLTWLPESCAYRLVAEGRDLHSWHPLVSGDPESVHRAGISVRGRARPEDPDLELQDFMVGWARPGGKLRPVRGRRRNGS